MATDTTPDKNDAKPRGKHLYEKPTLVVYGAVGTLTQSGGATKVHDGIFTNAPS